MTETRIKISSLIENQLPQFIIEEFPLASEFLSQYYTSLESQGNVSDILQNIDQYIKVDNLTNLIESTELSSDVSFFDTSILVKFDPENGVYGTQGFPDSYGLLLIDSEIITYTSKTLTSFEGCVRGFNGITSYKSKDQLVFSDSGTEEHSASATVTNLSILFLKEFFKKVKKQITPGFEDRELFSDLNERIFVKQSIDFYSSKGTDNSFKILFGALYGENVEVIRPRDYLIQPSSAQYRITADLVVESINGNPENLINQTLYQDEQSIIGKAQGTITKVEKIRRNLKDYYLISLDYDYDKDIQPNGTIFGQFSIHPKTKLTSTALSGAISLEVDSTVGFADSGIIQVALENDTFLNIDYKSKTLNQFLECSGISQDISIGTEIKSEFFAYGYYNNDQIKIRILGVLSELEIPNNTRFYSKNDKVRIKTLGADPKDIKSNNWFFNIASKYEVDKILLENNESGIYKIILFDEHYFKLGDSVSLVDSTGVSTPGTVILLSNDEFEKSITIECGSNFTTLNENASYFVRRTVSKVLIDDTKYDTTVNQYTSNIQNVYISDEGLYVASPSLPSYSATRLEINDRSVSFSGSFSPDNLDDLTEGTTLDIGNHKLYTGDAIVYKPTESSSLGISTGIYFIKKIDRTKVKLARSKSNIFNGQFIAINSSVDNAKFEILNNTYDDLSTRLLESQKLIRKISNPETDGTIYETNSGMIGIFINGVEILNYKSNDNVYYGPIESIVPTSSGSGYDVINPPTLSISDPIGFGATAYCSVIGKLEKIDIIDPGFDYLESPIIEISGGNGYDASAKANLVSFDHEVSFSASSQDLIKLNPTNTIGFSTYHKFRTIEEIVYVTNGQPAIVGLVTNSIYFVSVQDQYNVKLYKSFSDAASGINTIQLTGYGSGNHIFKSKNKKKKIGSIIVENSGKNYQNKLITTNASGINTASNTIKISNHGFNSGEIITYTYTENPIGGLSSEESYYVTKINNNEFKLSKIGISTIGITTSFYYDTKQYINITSAGSGTHKFNYPKINVTIKGKIGISTNEGFSQDFNAIINPIFRGKIDSVFVDNGGKNYGSEDILNYNRQPFFSLSSGSGIELTPVVSNGKIVNVLIKNPGIGYNSSPDLKVIGNGIGAELTPVILNGSLIGVKIINSGIGYLQEKTSIDVISSGSGAKFESKVKTWKVNLIQRLLLNNQINDDDGIVITGTNDDYGLQYTHGYVPKKLRVSVQGTKIKDGQKKYVQDLILDNGVEVLSDAHSPIIGWSYDGHPIYGPYGYSENQEIKLLKSSYEQLSSSNSNRPSVEIYPTGFFIEDYVYTGSGDLDEHNGKFGPTPEYPNGVYAYFCTVQDYKTPIFPYIIGPSYKSKPIKFNFSKYSNQDYIDLNKTNWKRNITPYNISTYEYLFNSNTITPQNSIIKSVSKGSVDSIGIITGGKNYKLNDKLVFESNLGKEINAKVSLIEGKSVDQISVETISSDVTLFPYENEFIGFTTIPNNFSNNDLVTFVGEYDYKKSGNISINNNILSLTTGVGSAQYTGIETYFNVSGNLNYPFIKENDIYDIQNEQIKILAIDLESSRIKVLRNQNGTLGITSYSAGIALTEKSRKFKINFGISTSYNFKLDKEFYFNPSESIGIGTSSGVGIFTTLYFSNVGAGITQLTIPTKTIYIKDHKLNTGDSLIYSSNGGTGISISTDGSSVYQLTDNSLVYAAKVSNDLIGISTIKVGIGSEGNFVSVGSTTPSNILYFTSVGSGNNHSFKTNYENKLTGKISKNVVTVSTAETHGLSLFDTVIIDVKPGISTSIIVKYNDYNRRLVINPRQFSSIDTETNIIEINNHGYYSGQKVIYTSTTPSVGLQNESIYFIVVIDSNKIKLSNSYYSAIKENPEVINIESSQPGVISPINPPITLIKNQNVIFDLSDSSLSFSNGSIFYSAFKFKLYKDEKLTEEFYTTGKSSTFEVSEIGKVGIDTGAKIILSINDHVPNILYYSLVPINLNINTQNKKEFIIDDEVLGSNKISLTESKYNGTYSVVGISSSTFKYNILNIPEVYSYNDNIKYYPNSSTASGAIKKVKLLNNEKKYTTVPNVTSILSDNGSGAILLADSDSIGKVLSTEIEDIGYDYTSDFSVRPTAKFPDILELDLLSTFDYIGITSFGRNYNIVPNIVVVDGLTNKQIKDVNLKYSFGDSKVTIIKNSTEINNVTPKIIPINNSNGIKIQNISYNNSTKDVTVTLGTSFSDPQDYPFFVGSKVLIEGVSVGVNSSSKGYNSSNYEYSLFTLTAVDPNIGGAVGIITYNLSSYLKNGEEPGTFSSVYSSAKVVPESYFPIFNPVLKKNNFYDGEIIYSETAEGIVESWDPNRQYLKVSTIDNFSLGQNIKGKTSTSVASIKNIISFNSSYLISSFSPRRKGWNTEIGFLNNDFQRVHDSNYYQYFSYDIRSQKDFNTWDNAVSTLNHTAGFKKFANLIIESTPQNVGILTDQNEGSYTGTADLSSKVSLNCVSDFDLAKENNIILNNEIKSDEIIFNSRIIQDYIESIGNRVLIIDDISPEFDSNPRPTRFSVVDSFLLGDVRSKKYIIFARDKLKIYNNQVSIVSLIHDDSFGFINQYGINSFENLGFFDFSVFGVEGNLLFYPVKYEVNDYDLGIFSFSLSDSLTGIGTINLGNSVNIDTNSETIPQGTNSPFTIVGIASTYRSSKVLVQIGSTTTSYFEYDEITVIHDDVDVYISQYGKLVTDNTPNSGIGTYHAYISGSEIKIDIIPNVITQTDYTVNTFNVSIANTSYSGIGTEVIGGTSMKSNSISIASSTSPTSNIISNYSNELYNCSYSLVVVEDLTNLNYQVSEFLTISGYDDCYITEFAKIRTTSALGITTAGISGTNTNIYFTPIQNIDVSVKVFQINIGISDQFDQINLI